MLTDERGRKTQPSPSEYIVDGHNTRLNIFFFNAFTRATFQKSCVDATQFLPRTDTQMFPLGSEARQATSRCLEGAEEVLSFVANSRSEDSLTHVILTLPQQECGAKLFAHFPSHVWGHAGVGRGGTPCGCDASQIALSSQIPTTVSD